MKLRSFKTVSFSFGVFAATTLLGLPTQANPPETLTLPNFSKLLGDRIAWPCGIELIRERKVMVFDGQQPMGFVGINAGVRVKATALTPDVFVTAEIAGQRFTVPVEETSLMDLLTISDDVRRLLNQASQPRKPRGAHF